VNVCALFASLAAAGVLPGTAAAAPATGASRPTPPPLQPQQPARPPLVPTNAGANMPAWAQSGGSELTSSMLVPPPERGGWEPRHVRRQLKGKVKGAAPPSRRQPPPRPRRLHAHSRPCLRPPAPPSPHGLPHLPPRRWYLPVEEWKRYVHTDADDSAPSVFDALQAPPGGAAAADGAAGSGAAAVFQPVLRLPPGCSEATCAVCGEKFALRWDDAAEEWLLIDAVAGAGGRITHSGCVA